ncbi:cysteine desulfurase CsdA [Pectobacterium atrosepticum]|uniref:cysteine desulfurase CsdA n=1 Tax=Pectobacterium atrosepticum TaxID=29471 RepID=UPI00049A3170|nr:cysteine desulfurase CsdA [Pectobacterium atrosepticum]AIA69990.1 cysteine sulfinate desulfinase [Pectobacterium atrosepticum]AIK12909.1 cysteine sulfinate desulfinase [Pectobacterium atrosepticum]POW29846.1 cysteine sulfinate desulfinase [Pectobacterium atrosepticum]
MTPFNPATFRQQFPALQHSAVYLDSAATALKPQSVIDAVQQFYCSESGTVHRSQHRGAQVLTQRFEGAREQVATLLHANDPRSIVWTRGSTEAINLVAQSYARPRLQPGDEIIVSEAEHHANLIPWLMVAQQTGASVVKLPIGADLLPDIEQLTTLITPKTRLLALGQMSNVTGGQPDLARAITLAHRYGAVVMVDGAQGIVHCPPDVQALDIDFYAFSGHKLYAPTGIGVLYGKTALLESMMPWQGGGKMMTQVSFDGFLPQAIPQRFEAGTPHIAGVLGLSAALDWLTTLDWHAAEQHSQQLAQLAETHLAQFPGFRSFRSSHSSVLSFDIADVHHSDLITLLAESGIALRAGHHCAQPLMDALGISGTIRASFAPYNNQQDVAALIAAIGNALELLSD